MADVKAFRALRPNPELVSEIISLPYDVMNRKEAAEMAEGKKWSFLHITRAEIDLPDEPNAYADAVYQKGKENLLHFEQQGALFQDPEPYYYIYRQIMDGRVQTGVVAGASIDEYLDNRIKKHELTREAKEQDRIRHFDICDANTEPIFLCHRYNEELDALLREFIKFNKPNYNITTEDGISHIFWAIDDQELNAKIRLVFQKIPVMYIADGHHRSASGTKVGQKRRAEQPNYSADAEFNYVMAVIFPDRDLFIMDYNRVVKDLNGHSEAEFLKLVSEKFDLREAPKGKPYRPRHKGQFGLLLGETWYEMNAKPDLCQADNPVDRLDVQVLQVNVLDPILGIKDPRTDERIDFVGGIRGLGELEKRVKTDMKVAFSMFPTSMDDLIEIADAGQIMPPKSTWFEPKLRSGFFVHKLS